MAQYYYIDGQNQKGPFTIEALSNENINGETLAWKEGMDDWIKIKDIPELEPVLRKIPPPAPKPSGATSQAPNFPEQPASAVSTEDQQLASAGNRFLAYLIDAVLITVVGLIPVLGAIVGIVYFLLRDALPFLNGQSIGKKAMKIRAVRADNGAPLTDDYGKSALRNVSLLIPIFGLIDAFMVFSDDKKRFGDKWAETKVVIESGV